MTGEHLRTVGCIGCYMCLLCTTNVRWLLLLLLLLRLLPLPLLLLLLIAVGISAAWLCVSIINMHVAELNRGWFLAIFRKTNESTNQRDEQTNERVSERASEQVNEHPPICLVYSRYTHSTLTERCTCVVWCVCMCMNAINVGTVCLSY